MSDTKDNAQQTTEYCYICEILGKRVIGNHYCDCCEKFYCDEHTSPFNKIRIVDSMA